MPINKKLLEVQAARRVAMEHLLREDIFSHAVIAEAMGVSRQRVGQVHGVMKEENNVKAARRAAVEYLLHRGLYTYDEIAEAMGVDHPHVEHIQSETKEENNA